MMFKKIKLLESVTLYRSGSPFKTQALSDESYNLIESALSGRLEDLNVEESNNIQYLYIENQKEYCNLSCTLSDMDRVYGLGEAVGPLNRRGKVYRLYATDNPVQTPDREFLYGSHPFVIINGSERTFGIFVDYPSEIIFDISFTNMEVLKITLNSKNFDLYIIDGENVRDVIDGFLRLVGAPYIPPKWAFGYQQCRWSYPDRKTVETVAGKFRELNFPCDAIYMDIDYMVDYKVFTIDDKKFPNFSEFVKSMKDDGFNIVPIIDPGVKIESGYSVYEEGIDGGFFCKNSSGENFVGAVWPGPVHFPDFLNPRTVKWWGRLYKGFVDAGVLSFWNDMNEPSIFYTDEALDEIFGLVDNMKETGNFDKFLITQKAKNVSNRRDYYMEIYQKCEDGYYISHDNVHNLYGFHMASASARGLMELADNKRHFLLSRSSFIGLHRTGAIWTGDNHSWWEHMVYHMRALMSLGMCGFFYSGADIGGFGGHVSPELLIRWMQLGVFSPLYRNHSAWDTRIQEPWTFDNRVLEITREAVRFRYALLPYYYSEFIRCVNKRVPFITPLSFSFNMDNVVDDQFMCGDSILAAPVCKANDRGRAVILPDVKWLFWPVRRHNEKHVSVLSPGCHYVNAGLDEIPVFIKENSLVALTEPVNYVGEKDMEVLYILGFVTNMASFIVYEDDGYSYDYKQGVFTTIEINVQKTDDGNFEIKLEKSGTYNSKVRSVHFEIYDENGIPFVAERPLPFSLHLK